MALKNLFRPSLLTTADVLGQFQQLGADLAKVRDKHTDVADEHESAASQLISDANAARREATRAGEALKRVEAVFGASA